MQPAPARITRIVRAVSWPRRTGILLSSGILQAAATAVAADGNIPHGPAKQGFWLTLLLMFACAGLIILVLFVWNRSLQSLVRRKTQELSRELAERARADQALQAVREQLERLVGERTAKLTTANNALLAEISGHKLTEQALQESEQRYREVFLYASDGIFLIDVTSDGRFRLLDQNPAGEELLRLAKAEISGKLIEEFLPREVNESVEAALRRCIDAGSSISYEEKVDCPAGHGDFYTTLVPLKDPTGRLHRIIGIFHDITKSKKTEEQLRSLGERLALATRAASIGVWDWDQSAGLFTWDRRMFEVYSIPGTSPVPYEVWAKTVMPDDLPGVEMALHQAASRKTTGQVEFRIVRPDGAIRSIQSAFGVVLDRNREVSRVVGVNIDVTERRQAEKSLRNSQRMLQSVLDTIPVRVFWKDINSRYRGCNRSFAAAAGINAPEEVIGKTDFDLPWAERAEGSHLEDQLVMKTGTPKVYYAELQVAGGGRIWARQDKIPLFDDEGRVSGVLGTFDDMTDFKSTEEELHKVQKLESIGMLAGGIAHDFNNLLGIILGNISLARMSLDPAADAIKSLKEAEKAIRRSRGLTQQLTIFAKGGSSLNSTESIVGILKDAVDLGLTGSNLECRLDADEDLRPVNCDPGRIHQALLNMIINAKEAMPEGGILEIRARNTGLKEDEIPMLGAGEYVEISITDHGAGIPGEHLSKIFDPYFSTKERGTQKGMGLGLTIAYSIVRRHGGNITVGSKPGGGTTFHIYLPAEGGSPVAEVPHGETPPSGSGRVLLMDDEKMFCEMAGQMLSRAGYDVELASDGTEAVRLFRAAREAGKGFDIVILDLTVRGGAGGRETVRELLEIDPSLKAVASTGYSEDPVVSGFRDYGFSGVLVKPYGVNELRRLLHGLLHGEGAPERTTP